MFQVCQGSAKWSLILRILREIGLRISAICYLNTTCFLMTPTPRHVCCVPEKGKTWRSFVTRGRAVGCRYAYACGLRHEARHSRAAE